MGCPKCNSLEKAKNGIVNALQRYKCKHCSYNYTVSQRSGEYSKTVKRQALHLYLEGLGFRSTGRILNVSNVSVLNWIKVFEKELKDLQSDSHGIEFVELDEMHSYIGNKKTVDQYGKRFLNFVIDDRSKQTAKRFWESIKHHQMKLDSERLLSGLSNHNFT